MSEHPTSPTAFSALFEKKQEPVKIFQYNCLCGRTMKFESVHGVIAPQRTWVGLTKEDKDLIEDLCEMMIGDAAFSTIDAILKGKNT